MKVSVVISIKNRTKLFKRSLETFKRQTLPANEFELVVVDDASEEDVKLTLETCGSGLNIQYIRIDSSRNDFPIFWGPALSNNVGFKASTGDVTVITGPEILHRETNLEYAFEAAQKDILAFGHVFHSGPAFVRYMDVRPTTYNSSYDTITSFPTAKMRDITHNTYYWFICAVKREHIMAINGCDEEYMKGICGDDDDFANRIDALGIKKTHDFRIEGIHQDHTAEDRLDPKRRRRSNVWEVARLRNTKYLDDWYTVRNRTPYANLNRDWGSDRLILSKHVIHKVE